MDEAIQELITEHKILTTTESRDIGQLTDF